MLPSTYVDASSKGSLGRCGSYELLVELATGGMATVYLARAADGREAPLVAIKKPHRHLATDKNFFSMLVDEARLASTIRHDNVVPVRELAFEGGEPFIVMNYVEGGSLADVRKELAQMERALDSRFALRITLDALAGLQAAHVLHDESGRHLGIVHRDVSPHNVLLGCDGIARLTDFGIAKAVDRVQVTHTHEVKGKFAYLAPERIDKRRLCTVQSDVFSMAVVLWECIAGRRLFRGDEPVETLQEIMTAPIPSLRAVGVPIPQALDDAIARGLDRDLDTRYKTAAEFSAALTSAAGRGQVATPSEVASLVEALFGEHLRVRHEHIRLALADDDVRQVLELSGLHLRPAPTDAMRARERMALENMAPPAPSARYTFGHVSERGAFHRRFASPKARAIVLAGVGLLGVSVLATVLMRGKEPAREVVTAPPSEPAFRRIVVPLPFPATKITFDEQARDFLTPTDVAAFDIPRESGTRHRVTALSPDGARAEAFVREVDGFAKPEGEGYAIEDLETYDEPAPSASATTSRPPREKRKRRTVTVHPPPSAATSAPKPAGTVKDGFTKLK